MATSNAIVHQTAKRYDTVSYCTAVIRATCAAEALAVYNEQFGGEYYQGPGQSFGNAPYCDGWDRNRKGYRVTQRCGLDI